MQRKIRESLRKIIDTSKPDVETVLTEEDFRSFTTHGDITKLGIKVKDDPTMGNKMEGDIAIDNLKKFVDDSNKLGRNAIRQAYRLPPNPEWNRHCCGVQRTAQSLRFTVASLVNTN
ncbi:hypothetical protein ANCDUO_06358 [Ancylostoma duodenale]|uniref:Uncharacterized protein n=1 Tax=Ancylostoma duodenale TaxID=51022 RepID=A0A0C2H1T5_9BILA|nr:hypothetical protein ANCDUO_06358 [Ancylostoma duodenale]